MTDRDLPAAVYAAAGASDLAYQRLRRLPGATTRALDAARRSASELREQGTPTPTRLDGDRLATGAARLRESTRRGGEMVVARAAEFQERAVSGYRHLVQHGEHVVASRTGGTQASAPTAVTGTGVRGGVDVPNDADLPGDADLSGGTGRSGDTGSESSTGRTPGA